MPAFVAGNRGGHSLRKIVRYGKRPHEVSLVATAFSCREYLGAWRRVARGENEFRRLASTLARTTSETIRLVTGL